MNMSCPTDTPHLQNRELTLPIVPSPAGAEDEEPEYLVGETGGYELGFLIFPISR